MTPPLPPENGPEPRPDQLHDLLRAAIEQVRQEPVPEPRLNRALTRARRLRRQPPSSRFQRIQLIIALTTLAAVLLLSLMFLMHLALLPSSEVKSPRKDDPPGQPSDDHRRGPNKFNQRKHPLPSPDAAGRAAGFLPAVFAFPESPARK